MVGFEELGMVFLLLLFVCFKDFVCLFLERGEREGEEQQLVCLSHAPIRGPGPLPRRVP